MKFTCEWGITGCACVCACTCLPEKPPLTPPENCHAWHEHRTARPVKCHLEERRTLGLESEWQKTIKSVAGETHLSLCSWHLLLHVALCALATSCCCPYLWHTRCCQAPGLSCPPRLEGDGPCSKNGFWEFGESLKYFQETILCK